MTFASLGRRSGARGARGSRAAGSHASGVRHALNHLTPERSSLGPQNPKSHLALRQTTDAIVPIVRIFYGAAGPLRERIAIGPWSAAMHRRFPFLVPCQLAWQEHQVGSLWLFSDMARPLAGLSGRNERLVSYSQHTCLANQPASPVGQAGQGSSHSKVIFARRRPSWPGCVVRVCRGALGRRNGWGPWPTRPAVPAVHSPHCLPGIVLR
jgi:hypothetical protein